MFRLRQQWTPWWLAAPMLIGYIGFGVILYRAMGVPGEYARIPIPAYLLLGILVVPAAINARIIVAGPEGLRVTNGPIPKGRFIRLKRGDIRCCNVRVQYSDFESGSGGSTAPVPNYLVGVETWSGEQVDIAYPYLKFEKAQAVVAQLAEALNQDRSQARIPIEQARRLPTADARRVWRVLAWGVAFIAAIIAGAAWELTR